MMGWGDGWGGGWGGSMFGLVHLLWWFLLVVAVVVVVRWLIGAAGSSRRTEDRALEILKERYARGEIDKAEFDARKRDLA